MRRWLVDLAIARGDDVTAQTLLEQLIEKRISPSMDRTARVRLRSLQATGAVKTAMVRYFSTDSDAVQVHWLELARAEQPQDAWVAYLLGRRLHQREAFAEALKVLEVTLADVTMPESIRRETIRLMLESAYGAGACEQVTQLAETAKSISGPFGARARDWVDRCTLSGPPLRR